MNTLDINCVRKWCGVGGKYAPSIITMKCPNCMDMVGFACSNHTDLPHQGSNACVAICPICDQSLSVFVADPPEFVRRTKPKPADFGGIVVHPSPGVRRGPISGIELVPDRIKNSYQETLDAFNANVWSASASLAGRTLEGVLQEYDDDSKRKALAERIRELGDKAELTKPLIDIADIIRENRNIGAHFDSSSDITPESARDTIRLLEYLLEYLFTVPSQIEYMKSKLRSNEIDDNDAEQAD